MEKYKRLTMEGSCFDNIINCVVCPNKTEKYTCRKDKTNCLKAVINYLSELEDKIEDGTLIKLPCKVGEKVYHIDCYPHIFEDIVDEIWINSYNEVCYDFRNGCRYLVSEFGVKWFTDKSKAEEKLKELKIGGSNGNLL